MQIERPEDFIFPARPFDGDVEMKYKESIIQIPTGRKTNDNKINNKITIDRIIEIELLFLCRQVVSVSDQWK